MCFSILCHILWRHNNLMVTITLMRHTAIVTEVIVTVMEVTAIITVKK